MNPNWKKGRKMNFKKVLVILVMVISQGVINACDMKWYRATVAEGVCT